VSLTAQQPYNNVARVAWQALAAVLGGCQSLHTNALDEALALPTAEAATLALRTQQVIAYESGVTEVPDPLGGSYFLEKLTRDLQDGAEAYFRRLDAMGGMVAAVEQGFPQREVADASYRYQQALERGDKVMVGVNQYTQAEQPLPTLYIDESAFKQQAEKLKKLRARRSNEAVAATLATLRAVAQGEANTMPALLDCVRANCTVGEICDTLRQVFGDYQETAIT
ncbi:MAG: methylmalonyl-CoA mutase family protein, partial [Chloroflexota bacterium]